MERAFSYFIIPFQWADADRKSYSITDDWTRVEKSRSCELHSYITERMFGKTDIVCEIYDRERKEAFMDNKTGRTLTLLFTRIFLYKEDTSFAVFCVQYDEEFTIDDVIDANSRLKYINAINPLEFSEEHNPDYYSKEISEKLRDNYLGRKLRALMKKIGGDIVIPSEKALLCVYGVCPDEQMNKQTLFYLATGNSRRFAYSEDTAFSTYTQSETVIHGLCREGIAVITCESGGSFTMDKSSAFSLVGNYRENYLLMYIIILCQYYGFREYNRKALSLYKQNRHKPSVKELDNLRNNADVFYLENVHSDVSQITHQNRIYEELLRIYNISALINDFKEDINICNRLLEQKKLNSKMIVIVFSTLAAAIAGIIDVLANFTSVLDFLFR